MTIPLACAAAVLVLLPASAFLPLMESTFRNILFEESRLVSSVGVIYTEVWFPFAFGFLFFAFIFPAVRAIFQILVLGSVLVGIVFRETGRIFRWSEQLRTWSMADVVVIGGIIAYYRAAVPSRVELEPGAWLYIGVAVFALLGDLTLDRRRVWSSIMPDREAMSSGEPSCDVCELIVAGASIGDACPRCGEKLGSRVVIRFVTALTAVAAALPLCIPSFSTAVMVNNQLTGTLEHTVLGTIQLIADYGMWTAALVLFLAGVTVPLFELAALSWLLLRVRFPSVRGLVLRTRVHRLLRHLMRWPMIIPFTAAIAAPIIDFRGVDDIISGPGATPLFMVITLMMLGISVLEPRLMWRSAGEAE